MPEIYLSIHDHDLYVRIQYTLVTNVFPVPYVPVGVSAWISVLEKK